MKILLASDTWSPMVNGVVPVSYTHLDVYKRQLHDQHGLAVPAADLIALAALHGGVVVVHIVELDLHHLDFRVVGQDLLQYLGICLLYTSGTRNKITDKETQAFTFPGG